MVTKQKAYRSGASSTRRGVGRRPGLYSSTRLITRRPLSGSRPLSERLWHAAKAGGRIMHFTYPQLAAAPLSAAPVLILEHVAPNAVPVGA